MAQSTIVISLQNQWKLVFLCINRVVMIHKRLIERSALNLRHAYTQGAIAPLRHLFPATTDNLQIAYAIQQCNTAHWVQQGRQVIGYKIGLTAPVVQQQLGVSEPDMGVLFADMAQTTDESIPFKDYLQPKIEAEIALCLKSNITKRINNLEALAPVIDYVLPAIEIVDSRIQQWDIQLLDTVADNASAAGFVLGGFPKTLAEIDLLAVKMTLQTKGKTLSEGVGANCLEHPLKAALWLVNHCVDTGQPLRAGQIILTGALGPMVDVQAENYYKAQLAGLGEVSIGFHHDKT